MPGTRVRVAIDIGGTFTDLVAYSEGSDQLFYSKSLTTHEHLSDGVLDCLRLAKVDLPNVDYLIHGSTIAINTVIQRLGAKTGLITTKGFRDVYAIGRGDRPDPYNLIFEKAIPLVSRDRIGEVDERLNARGEVVRPLDRVGADAVINRLVDQGVELIAVVLLHGYRNPEHERAVGEAIRRLAPNVYVCLSHEILREFREFERTSTTVLNAYVGPIVSKYVRALQTDFKREGFEGNFLIMQSNGGTMSAEAAAAKPVSIMESGPVAGVIGCAELGAALGLQDVISFDMGGTTAKASLVDKGQTRVVTGYYIGGSAVGHPMMLPVVDIVEVGAGGGSIAWIDASGGLKVGPVSAGSSPGPACYGKGGTEPTITDANLVLGRLDANNFLGGQMRLDVEAARQAIVHKVAEPLGFSMEESALGIIKIADAKMSLAVREVSVAKGHDPRQFALIATGGAGPLHAASIARELSLPKVIIPDLPGTFSALGMLTADVRHDYVRTFIVQMRNSDPTVLTSVFEEMTSEAAAALRRDGIETDDSRLIRSLDLRYEGQEYTLTVPLPTELPDRDVWMRAREHFDDLHHARYSHSAPGESVEIVNLRLTAVGKIAGKARAFGSRLSSSTARSGKPKGRRKVHFDEGVFDCALYDRAAIIPGEVIAGPVIIEEQVSTSVIPPGARVSLSDKGPLIIEMTGAPS